MSEFSWWLLIVGLVVGAALVWLVLADSARREAEVEERELPVEAAWIAAELRAGGRTVGEDAVEEVLRLHRAYLAVPPPDEPSVDGVPEPPRSAPDSSSSPRSAAGDASDVQGDRPEA